MENVFDVSQTTMPFEEINKSLNPMIEDPRADSVADIFIKAIYKDGFKVKYDDIPNGAKGYCDFDKKGVFERMFENYRCIKVSLDNLNGYDDFYYEDVETREKHYDDNDKDYYRINDDWEKYFSDYLLKNMPE